jgi:hypothetical protein
MLNWRPVYDIEQETERLRQRNLDSAKQTKLLESEIAQLDIEIEQIKTENKRLAALESRLDALLLSADSSSQTTPAAGSN